MASEGNQNNLATSLGAATAAGEPSLSNPTPSAGGEEVNLTDVTLSVMNNNDKRDEDFEDASSVRI
jgi:hypothetical protein